MSKNEKKPVVCCDCETLIPKGETICPKCGASQISVLGRD